MPLEVSSRITRRGFLRKAKATLNLRSMPPESAFARVPFVAGIVPVSMVLVAVSPAPL